MSLDGQSLRWVRLFTSEWTAIAVVSLALWFSLRDSYIHVNRSSSSTSHSYTAPSVPSVSPSPFKYPPPSMPPSTSSKSFSSSSTKGGGAPVHTPKVAPKIIRTFAKPLTPKDLPDPVLFSSWENITIFDLPGASDDGQIVAHGAIQQTASQVHSNFAVLPAVLNREAVSEILKTLHHGVNHNIAKASDKGPQVAVTLDSEPDSVDGMSSQEIFLDNDSLRMGRPSKSDPNEDMTGRASLRQHIKSILDPVLDDIITPFVRKSYPEICNEIGRRCTPCYSLIRRYRTGERISHAPHHDKHSLVTVVVSLSDYNADYTGGLYVATQFSERNYLALNRGDAVVHQGDLYHGVQLLNETPQTERWSWILWYRDSELCNDHSQEWYDHCAEKENNPTCQYLKATAVGDIDDVVYWNERAADQGHGAACVKLARAYLKLLHSNLSLDPDKAMGLYQKAIDSVNEPDGHFGLAAMKSIILHHEFKTLKLGDSIAPNHPLLIDMIRYLENAARLLHPFAMFNLGIVHSFGYGDANGIADPQLGAEWFAASGLPEGYAARAEYENSIGNVIEAEYFKKRAQILGYGSNFRVQAREITGYGGAGGVSLNLFWPPLSDGRSPSKW